MDQTKFEKVFEDQIQRSRDILIEKAREYADDSDRLHNFTQAAHLAQETTAQALGGMMMKHTVSIYDMIQSGSVHTPEKWDEKITDHINYLILLRAVVEEEYSQRTPEIEYNVTINKFMSSDEFIQANPGRHTL